MMLRVFFVLMGLFTAGPQVSFLFLSHKYFPNRDTPKEWWSGVTLRLVSAAFLTSGGWLFFVNAAHINEQLNYSWFDAIATILITSIGASASIVLTFNYLRYRNWNV